MPMLKSPTPLADNPVCDISQQHYNIECFACGSLAARSRRFAVRLRLRKLSAGNGAFFDKEQI